MGSEIPRVQERSHFVRSWASPLGWHRVPRAPPRKLALCFFVVVVASTCGLCLPVQVFFFFFFPIRTVWYV